MEEEKAVDREAELEAIASEPSTFHEGFDANGSPTDEDSKDTETPDTEAATAPEGSRTVLTDVGETPVVIPVSYSQPRPMKVAIYQCLNQRCRSKTDPKMPSYDRLRLFPAESVPAIIDCQNCGAGRGIPTQKEMYAQQKGMILIGTYMIDMNDDENTPGLAVTQSMVDRAKAGH